MVTKVKLTIAGKKQLTDRIVNNLSKKVSKLNKSDLEQVINEFLSETKKALVKGEEIRLTDYFTLKTTLQKSRVVMNLQTKKKMTIPVKRVPKVKFADDLKKEIAKK